MTCHEWIDLHWLWPPTKRNRESCHSPMTCHEGIDLHWLWPYGLWLDQWTVTVMNGLISIDHNAQSIDQVTVHVVTVNGLISIHHTSQSIDHVTVTRSMDCDVWSMDCDVWLWRTVAWSMDCDHQQREIGSQYHSPLTVTTWTVAWSMDCDFLWMDCDLQSIDCDHRQREIQSQYHSPLTVTTWTVPWESSHSQWTETWEWIQNEIRLPMKRNTTKKKLYH